MKIDKSDFEFRPISHGLYRVSYVSPVTGKKWTCKIDDMTIIDVTKNVEYPKVKDLEMLRRIVKFKSE